MIFQYDPKEVREQIVWEPKNRVLRQERQALRYNHTWYWSKVRQGNVAGDEVRSL